ncbi:IclR family transcriptional regulator C-terminal domain-containing protein [Aquicoccus sp. SU-CL01552]|uniref:IclR family transcriptional regulator domain-containing protein n=1 Tax=Aquicoccus sp. SU-CL01552 TaxID=3127656 RepID=UPI003109CED6
MVNRSDFIGSLAKGLSVLEVFGGETPHLSIAEVAEATGLMPGSRLPAHCPSMGRRLFAALPPPQARALIDRFDLTPHTVNCVTDPGEIMDRIAQVRTDGFAIIEQQGEIGLRSLAVPVLNARGFVIAALNTGLAVSEADLVRDHLPKLLRVQAGLRKILT